MNWGIAWVSPNLSLVMNILIGDTFLAPIFRRIWSLWRNYILFTRDVQRNTLWYPNHFNLSFYSGLSLCNTTGITRSECFPVIWPKCTSCTEELCDALFYYVCWQKWSYIFSGTVIISCDFESDTSCIFSNTNTGDQRDWTITSVFQLYVLSILNTLFKWMLILNLQPSNEI